MSDPESSDRRAYPEQLLRTVDRKTLQQWADRIEDRIERLSGELDRITDELDRRRSDE